MIFSDSTKAHFLSREKRFMMHMRTEEGQTFIAHCPNSGSMKGVLIPQSPVILTKSLNPKRKFPYTVQMIQVSGVWVTVNTHLANHLVAEVLRSFGIDFQHEVPYGKNSRVDFLLKNGPLYVEVKSVHMSRTEGLAEFPDSVTQRGHKHLEELMTLLKQGVRCALIYVIQRNDVLDFQIAEDIDPLYGALHAKAKAMGLEENRWFFDVSPYEIRLKRTEGSTFSSAISVAS